MLSCVSGGGRHLDCHGFNDSVHVGVGLERTAIHYKIDFKFVSLARSFLIVLFCSLVWTWRNDHCSLFDQQVPDDSFHDPFGAPLGDETNTRAGGSAKTKPSHRALFVSLQKAIPFLLI